MDRANGMIRKDKHGKWGFRIEPPIAYASGIPSQDSVKAGEIFESDGYESEKDAWDKLAECAREHSIILEKVDVKK